MKTLWFSLVSDEDIELVVLGYEILLEVVKVEVDFSEQDLLAAQDHAIRLLFESKIPDSSAR